MTHLLKPSLSAPIPALALAPSDPPTVPCTHHTPSCLRTFLQAVSSAYTFLQMPAWWPCHLLQVSAQMPPPQGQPWPPLLKTEAHFPHSQLYVPPSHFSLPDTILISPVSLVEYALLLPISTRKTGMFICLGQRCISSDCTQQVPNTY